MFIHCMILFCAIHGVNSEQWSDITCRTSEIIGITVGILFFLVTSLVVLLIFSIRSRKQSATKNTNDDEHVYENPMDDPNNLPDLKQSKVDYINITEEQKGYRSETCRYENILYDKDSNEKNFQQDTSQHETTELAKQINKKDHQEGTPQYENTDLAKKRNKKDHQQGTSHYENTDVAKQRNEYETLKPENNVSANDTQTYDVITHKREHLDDTEKPEYCNSK